MLLDQQDQNYLILKTLARLQTTVFFLTYTNYSSGTKLTYLCNVLDSRLCHTHEHSL